MCSPKWGQTYIRNQVAIRPSIENTIFVYNSQNPCLTTGLSYTALLQTQSPTQRIGSSSLWQWSPESLDYSSNSHLGSFHLLICPYTEFPWEHTVWGPKPRLHILNQYLLLLPSPVPSPRIPVQGASWSAVSPAFFFPSRSPSSVRGNGSIPVLGKHIRVCAYALECLWSCLKHIFTRHSPFTVASVYMDQRSLALG